MKFPTAPSVTALSLAASIIAGATARPFRDAATSWVQERAKKHMLKTIGKRTSYPNSTVSPDDCVPVPTATAPYENVWAGLTDPETASVLEWLFAQPDLNLSVSADADENDWTNSIQLVELNQPNKTDVLSYIAGGPLPAKYAHVLLNNRAFDEPHYQDILVGPLPIVNGSTSWQPLEYPFTRRTGGQIRNIEADSNALDNFYTSVAQSVANITLALYGTSMTESYGGNQSDVLVIFGIDPLWQDDGRIVTWLQFWRSPSANPDALTLLPQGLYFKADITGRDPANWEVQGWFYNNIFYETTEEFRTAFFSEGFERLPSGVDGEWAGTDRQGEPLPLDNRAPPATVAPSGARYRVDLKRRYIEWMDFSFFLGFTRDTGLSFHDIKYKGERIIYELTMQEALAHYAGNDPTQSGTSYLDSYYGFGPYAFELVPGYDCPAHATYMNSSFYTAETTSTHINSICMFEFAADYPIQRHSTSFKVSVTKNIYFSVRSVATIGNYDYAFTYSFYLDGSVGVEVRASGYIQSAYYAHNEDYGWQIHDALSGSMHDHVINFKADIDILGTSNSLMLLDVIPVSKTYPWSNGKARNTMQVTRRYIDSEDESRLNWGINGATQYIFVNQDAPNEYGSPRGYRFLPSAGTIHLTVEDSSNLQNAINWASHDLQITRQHDTEPRAAHPYATQDVANPPIDFNAFFDGESLLQEDLVLWFNLGMHHVPHTGDLPNTVFTTAHSGVIFSPLNYLKGDPSRQTVNQVRIEYGGGEDATVETFGQESGYGQGVCKASGTVWESESDLVGYRGDVAVRKFPYDPNDPFWTTESA